MLVPRLLIVLLSQVYPFSSRISLSSLAAAFVVLPDATTRRCRRPLLAFSKAFDEECSSFDDDDACLIDAGYTKSSSSSVSITDVYVAQVESLRNHHHDDSSSSLGTATSSGSNNVMKYQKRSSTNTTTLSSHVANLEYNDFVSDDQVILVDNEKHTTSSTNKNTVSRAFLKAGPRRSLHFDPSRTNACIVTCGGLCPGLNNVIRELVHSLHYLYGCHKIYGILGGFHGFTTTTEDSSSSYILLTNELVENIHHEGGTVLHTARGGFDVDRILQFLLQHDIHQLYVIGGDGTHRAAYQIGQACLSYNIAVAGIPKTIDNDVDYLDRSFGFASSVEAAQAAIRSAKTEASSNVPNGIGIVKLMGRSAGFLASYAALGSGDVDCVLIPEVPIVLEGPRGILPFLRRRVNEQQYAVVVVAEGAGEALLGGPSDKVDAGGNRERPKIGRFIKQSIEEYFETVGDVATVKYIDPSYMVRSVPANGADSLYCMELAQNAVHGAMAGLTCFTVGLVKNSLVYLPIPLVVSSSPRTMDPSGQIWERILAMTGQPNTAEKKREEKSNAAEDMSLPEPALR